MFRVERLGCGGSKCYGTAVVESSRKLCWVNLVDDAHGRKLGQQGGKINFQFFLLEKVPVVGYLDGPSEVLCKV